VVVKQDAFNAVSELLNMEREKIVDISPKDKATLDDLTACGEWGNSDRTFVMIPGDMFDEDADAAVKTFADQMENALESIETVR